MNACKICLDEVQTTENFLINPCKCTGSCGTVHIECLQQWIQVKVKKDLVLKIPDEIFNIKKFECTVRSNVNVATFIKEFVLELPPGEEVNFKAGGYIQIECPPHLIHYKDFDIEEEKRNIKKELDLIETMNL